MPDLEEKDIDGVADGGLSRGFTLIAGKPAVMGWFRDCSRLCA
jgi:hypothetical protein